MANIAEAIFRNISKPLSIFACSYVEASSRQTKPATSSLCLSPPPSPLCPGRAGTEAPSKQQQQQKSTKYDTMLQCRQEGEEQQSPQRDRETERERSRRSRQANAN